MAGRAEQKQESRARILASAGRGFRDAGYGGLGVDGLAKQAGVTSGAFYAHFKSKSEAFRETVAAGMHELRDGIEQFRRTHGAGWRRAFVDYYVGERRQAALPESCALQSLTGDVARSDSAARQVFQSNLNEALRAMTVEPADGAADRASAIALLALLSGAVSMARAVEDPALRDEIAEAARQAALRLT